MESQVNYPAAPRAIALDIDAECGVAANAGPGNIVSGLAAAPTRREPISATSLLARLDQLSAATNAEAIVYREFTRRGGLRRRRNLSELEQAVRTWAQSRGVECRGVSDFRMRRAFGLSGNCSGAEMVHAAWRRGFNPINHHEANALALLHVALSGGDFIAETIVNAR
jgi:hypothetical protein